MGAFKNIFFTEEFVSDSSFLNQKLKTNFNFTLWLLIILINESLISIHNKFILHKRKSLLLMKNSVENSSALSWGSSVEAVSEISVEREFCKKTFLA